MRYTMNAERKRLWLDALRSGLPQTRGTLHRLQPTTVEEDGDRVDPPGFCCLGVACKVAVENGLDLRVRKSGSGGIMFYGGSDAYMPPEVIEWLGLEVTDDEDSSEVGHLQDTLASKNDSGDSFETIADYIDENVEGWL